MSGVGVYMMVVGVGVTNVVVVASTSRLSSSLSFACLWLVAKTPWIA